MSQFSPREIVSELNRFIVGQQEAKRAVALALRNRWRRSRLPSPLREEVTPKNILMIGPTGVGKTEISRRLAHLADAPFLKVEATRFTEVGYVGRDVDQIIRDLLENAITMVRGQRREKVRIMAEKAAEDRILKALAKAGITNPSRENYRSGQLDDCPIEVEMTDSSSPLQAMEIPGQPGFGMGVVNLSDILGKAFGGRPRTLRTSVAEARRPLIDEECDKLLDSEAIVHDAIQLTEEGGIVFIDEIDKVARPDRSGTDISREGVQRDLLPMIEGANITTRHGNVRTDHILFIASGAFHVAAPSDLLPELQGRLPIRVELSPLSEADFQRILTEPEANLIEQYTALIATDGVRLSFDQDAIAAIAAIAVRVNDGVENIGARRLHTVMEKLLDDISFDAPDMAEKSVAITAKYVNEKLEKFAADTDLSRYIL